MLDETPEKARIIEKVANHYQYAIYRANSRFEDWTASLTERKQPPVEQWLKDFQNAKFVITDSFHATVFSILFEKPFIVIGNKERGLSRIYSLLKMLGLEGHMIHSLAELDLEQDYDWNVAQVNKVLETRRRESMEFLRKFKMNI